MVRGLNMVYTDADGVERGLLKFYDLSLAYGDDENDFEVLIPYGLPIVDGSRMYIDGTEWGGVVRGFREDTTGNTSLLYALGNTWHGLLAETILCPSDEDSHVQVSGDANTAINTVISMCGLDGVFDVSSETSGISVNYQFDRFCTVYDGLRKMLKKNDAKLKIAKNPDEKPTLYAEVLPDYTDGELALRNKYIAEYTRPVNHLVCTGEGELDERTVIHLYADENGNISQTQSIFGIYERTQHYDYTSADYDELLEGGTEKLEELQETSSLEITLPEDVTLDIGDVVVAQSTKTNLSVVASVNKVIVTVESKQTPNIEYELGEVSRTALYTKG